mgnify:FL=1
MSTLTYWVNFRPFSAVAKLNYSVGAISKEKRIMNAKAYCKKTAAFAGWLVQNVPSNVDMDRWMNDPEGTKKVLSGFKTSAADAIIRVDRSVRPSYPDWVERVEHPDLEPTGPTEYGISEVKQWFHDRQKNGKWIKGNEIHTYLKETDTLKTCFGLRDLEEIQKKGIAFFRKHFQGKSVFAWKSVVRSRDGYLVVPFLYEYGGKVVLVWYWLGDIWRDDYPALRFAS